MSAISSSFSTVGATPAGNDQPASSHVEQSQVKFARVLADKVAEAQAAARRDAMDAADADAADAADAEATDEAAERARDLATDVAASAADAVAVATQASADATSAQRAQRALASHQAHEGRGGAPARAVLADVGALAPEFRDRLDRVVSRMREAGHTVEIIETHRSQDRQDALFAQGRTADGPVVTWTRNSQHTKGRAADLLVDGEWTGGPGYADLARIASEEGLATLGAKDPGHVQLGGGTPIGSGTVAGRRAAALEAEAMDADGSRAARVARVAQVAAPSQVAQPASIAQVARVADVAQPGVAAAGRAKRGGGEQQESKGGGADAGAWALMAERAAVGVSGPNGEAAPTLGTNALERLGRIDALEAAADAQPMSFMTLRIDNAAGGTDRIRVDLRGAAVGASLEMGDAATASRLSANVGELQQALEKVGLEAQAVRVSSAPAVRDAAEAARAAATVTAAESEVRRAMAAAAPTAAQAQHAGEQSREQAREQAREGRQGTQQQNDSRDNRNGRSGGSAHREPQKGDTR